MSVNAANYRNDRTDQRNVRVTGAAPMTIRQRAAIIILTSLTLWAALIATAEIIAR